MAALLFYTHGDEVRNVTHARELMNELAIESMPPVVAAAVTDDEEEG